MITNIDKNMAENKQTTDHKTIETGNKATMQAEKQCGRHYDQERNSFDNQIIVEAESTPYQFATFK